MAQENDIEFYYNRSRSVAVIVRNGKILMERVFCFGYEFFTLPGQDGRDSGQQPSGMM